MQILCLNCRRGVRPSVLPSVLPSVITRYYIKTTQARITKSLYFQLCELRKTLLLESVKLFRKLEDGHPGSERQL